MMCYREVELENACRCSGVGTSIFPQLDRQWLGVELKRKETSSTHNAQWEHFRVFWDLDSVLV